MSTPLRHLMRRVILWQGDLATTGSGNILDLGPTAVLVTPGPVRSEERVALASGGQRPVRRSHRVDIPVTDEEAARFGEIMAQGSGCPDVQMLMLGTGDAEAWVWYEVTPLTTSTPSADAGSLGRTVLSLQTRVFDAAIWRGQDLLSGIPWEASTVEPDASINADLIGVGLTPGGDLLTVDSSIGSVQQHDGKTATVAEQYLVPNALTVAYGDWEQADVYLVATNAQSITEVNPATGQIKEVSTTLIDGNLLSIAYDSTAQETILADDTQKAYVIDTSGLPTLTSTIDLSGVLTDLPGGIAWDGTDLWVTDDATDLVQLDGKSNTVLNSFTMNESVFGIVFDGTELIGGVASSGANRIVSSDPASGTFSDYLTGIATQGQAGPIDAPGYEGPTWQVPVGFDPAITGSASGISTQAPATVQLVFPVPTATVQLAGVTGSIEARDWDGSILMSASGTGPSLELDDPVYAGTGLGYPVWSLRLTVEDAPARPELRLTEAGQAVGVREGGLVSACTDRVELPAWAATQLIGATLTVGTAGVTGVRLGGFADGFDPQVDALWGDGDSDALIINDTASVSPPPFGVSGIQATEHTYDETGERIVTLRSAALDELNGLRMRADAGTGATWTSDPSAWGLGQTDVAYLDIKDVQLSGTTVADPDGWPLSTLQVFEYSASGGQYRFETDWMAACGALRVLELASGSTSTAVVVFDYADIPATMENVGTTTVPGRVYFPSGDLSTGSAPDLKTLYANTNGDLTGAITDADWSAPEIIRLQGHSIFGDLAVGPGSTAGAWWTTLAELDLKDVTSGASSVSECWAWSTGSFPVGSISDSVDLFLNLSQWQSVDDFRRMVDDLWTARAEYVDWTLDLRGFQREFNDFSNEFFNDATTPLAKAVDGPGSVTASSNTADKLLDLRYTYSGITVQIPTEDNIDPDNLWP